MSATPRLASPPRFPPPQQVVSEGVRRNVHFCRAIADVARLQMLKRVLQQKTTIHQEATALKLTHGAATSRMTVLLRYLLVAIQWCDPSRRITYTSLGKLRHDRPLCNYLALLIDAAIRWPRTAAGVHTEQLDSTPKPSARATKAASEIYYEFYPHGSSPVATKRLQELERARAVKMIAAIIDKHCK